MVCLDVIEHFEKPEALALIAGMERWARRKVVLATPNGFLPQRVYDDNPFQEHKCGFSVAELCALGYRVHGTGGPKPLRGRGSRAAVLALNSCGTASAGPCSPSPGPGPRAPSRWWR